MGLRKAELLAVGRFGIPQPEALACLRYMCYPDTVPFMARSSTQEKIVSHPLDELDSYEPPDPDDGDDESCPWLLDVRAFTALLVWFPNHLGRVQG